MNLDRYRFRKIHWVNYIMSLTKGSTFTTKSGKKYTLAEDAKTASNGAKYAKMTSGKVVFISGASKQYLDSVRRNTRHRKKRRSSQCRSE
jgi:hypothetical protein